MILFNYLVLRWNVVKLRKFLKTFSGRKTVNNVWLWSFFTQEEVAKVINYMNKENKAWRNIDAEEVPYCRRIILK
jgi:hypothetical protein